MCLGAFFGFSFLFFSLILEPSAAMAELYKLTHPNHYKSVEGLRVEEHLLKHHGTCEESHQNAEAFRQGSSVS